MTKRTRLPYPLLALLVTLGCGTYGAKNAQRVSKASAHSITSSPPSSPSSTSIPVEGWGTHRYVYEPTFLPLPPLADVEHAHGIAMDTDITRGCAGGRGPAAAATTIMVTYKDAQDPTQCLLRWTNLTNLAEFVGPGDGSLCSGVPHGLIAAHEGDADDGSREATAHYSKNRPRGKRGEPPTVLYHANNDQALHKTTMNGDILWTVRGPLNDDGASTSAPYSPTWFASQPGSPYVYLADGYGSSKVYVLVKVHGNYTGHSFGGLGTSHGTFQTCHSITWDRRLDQMVVCDRENHRLEYFKVNATDPSIFEYTHTVSFYPLLQRPCNVRIRDDDDDDDGFAIVPFLEGSVGILNGQNDLVALVNITATLGDAGFLHPHDAHFVPCTSCDFVLATWNPGRVGYFRRVLSAGDDDGGVDPSLDRTVDAIQS